MRLATFEIDGASPNSVTTTTINQVAYLWLPLLAGVETDPMVETDGGSLRFNEAGLYVITANLNAQVILPADADFQKMEVTGALAFDPGGVGG